MERLKEALNKVDELLQREVEKRMELEELPPECHNAKVIEIRQAFIKEVRNKDNQPFCDVRVREEDGKKYSLTAKYRPLKHEANTEISKDMFEVLWKKSFSKQEKKRYVLESGWIVDQFKDGRIVAEFEYGENKQVAYKPGGFKTKAVLSKG